MATRKHNTTTEADIRRLVGEGLNFVRNSGCGAVTASPVALGWGRLVARFVMHVIRLGSIRRALLVREYERNET